MREHTLIETAAVPAALAAFLRGIERRGAVFAELQCGDALCGDAALAATMRAFREGATAVPITAWPHRFWALLLAAPPLRRSVPGARWPDGVDALAGLGSGPRAALLLRLVAGLQEADAASVLGIAQPTYRLALRRAVPRHADGHADVAGWQALVEASQLAIKQLPPARLAHLAKLREAALQQRRSRAAPSLRRPPTTGSRARPRWLLPALWTGLTACALGLAASFVLPTLFQPDGEPRIRRTPLPPAESPASTFDAQTALLTDPDFDMLLAADVAAAGSRDVGFQSWYAAQIAAGSAASAAMPIVAVQAPAGDAASTSAGSAASGLESIDAPR